MAERDTEGEREKGGGSGNGSEERKVHKSRDWEAEEASPIGG
jgi:hypothetical protein